MFQELTIDLRLPPDNRWRLTPTQCQQARELLISYKADLGLTQDVADFLSASASDLVRTGHWLEMESLSTALDLPLGDIALCNLYYDALKIASGLHRFRCRCG